VTKRVLVKKKTGRKPGFGIVRTPENADLICRMLEEGTALKHIASMMGLTTESEIVRWGNDREGAPEFAQRYARARIAYWERLADQVIDIADETAPVDALGHIDTGWVQQQRLRSDNRKWLLSKALPKKYGDKVTQEITGDASAPLLTRIELVAVPPRARIETDSTKTIDHEPEDEEGSK
jgi:hypothetical protein